ncbi:transposase [Bacillus cereus]|uniref:IS1595-like element ISLca5 family transposase n=1 Tax=Bacillus paranthracis TaxID=2026186 RepID=UPI0002975692|nr:IS1595-like element ISLca5 family transposase [Bacillus paranthracis]EKP97575.1 transposase [Lacticaseibacillus casei 21/1]KXI78053.1 transposase [Bacillus cereus]MED1169151.1 IS1595-like element ISLca5 family transposase [Bacillus paranthracis]
MSLKEIIEEIRKLNTADQHRLKQFFVNSLASYSASEPVFKEVSERKHKEGYTCTHCHSTKVVRFGKYSVKMDMRLIERQRYRCKDCGKTFTDVTNTPLHRTHLPHKWLGFIQCMIEGYSLRKASELIEVHYVTLFYWRHKLLSAMKQMDFEKFEGIVEMDETYFLYSEKGKRNLKGRKPRKRGGSSKKRGISKDQVCVLVARDRQKMTYSKIIGQGRIVKTRLDDAIGSKLSSTNVLCTDAWRAFKTYATDKGLEHYRFKSDGYQRVKGVYHIQNVNSYHSRLKGWIDRFNGVATKYLDHYLSWFRFLDSIRHRNNDATVSKMIIESCLFSTVETYDKLRLSEFSK